MNNLETLISEVEAMQVTTAISKFQQYQAERVDLMISRKTKQTRHRLIIIKGYIKILADAITRNPNYEIINGRVVNVKSIV